MHEPWLPDGATTYLLSYQKFQLGYISVGLGTQNVDMFNARLVHFKAFWHILWLFGNFVVIPSFFLHFGIL
jgi:hypothetical protein